MDDLEQAYVEISPAIAATHLYLMRQIADHGLRIPPRALRIPTPGTPTYNWATYGDPDLTEEEIDEIMVKRRAFEKHEAEAREQATKKRQQTDEPDDNSCT